MRTQDHFESVERDALTGAPPGTVIETKEFLRTSEFWMTLATVFVLVVSTLALESLDAPRMSLLITILAATYTLSRGIAKAGSAHPFFGRDMSLGDRFGSDNRREDGAHGSDPYGSRGSQAADGHDELRHLEARLRRLEAERHIDL
jgi:hypothetical protein